MTRAEVAARLCAHHREEPGDADRLAAILEKLEGWEVCDLFFYLGMSVEAGTFTDCPFDDLDPDPDDIPF